MHSLMKNLAAGSLMSISSIGYAIPSWFTIETEHFNVHYTQGHKSWAESAAHELELVRDKVIEQQQRSLEAKADVVVFDPYHGANGFAIPSTDKPLMALFTTPPQSDTVISNSSGWQQLLILHEYIHLVHLSQPNRSTWRQTLRDVWDPYDIALAVMPRWVAEGYATLMESKMTGRGRLYDNYTEALLTEFARQGALLPYSALNNGNDSYLSGSMAYLIGVRYLAWLEKNYGEHTLDAVWTRMQAVESRNFDEAFKGIFGDHPAKLYKRFVAEYTYISMASAQALPELDTQLWHDFKFDAKNLRLSPNSELVAVTERDSKGRTALNVYTTQENTEAQEDFTRTQRALLESDPKDIANKAPDTFGRNKKYTLTPENFAGIRYARWKDDKTLYFIASVQKQDNQHAVQGELFQWHIERDEVTQLTQNAGIRRFSISKNTKAIVAEKVRYGYSSLVNIELASGTETLLSNNQLGDTFDYPEFAPNGDYLAFLKASLNQNWQLYIRNTQNQSTLQVPAPKGYQFLTQPSWSADGRTLFYVAGVNGQINLYAYHLDSQQLKQLSHGQQVVNSPQQLSDGNLLYLGVSPEGPDAFQLSKHHIGSLVTELSDTKQAPKLSTAKVQLEDAEVFTQPLQSQVYDKWEQSASMTLGSQYHSASTSVLHVGVKGSDFLEELSWHVGLTKSLGDETLAGGFADVKLQQENTQWRAKLFSLDLDTTEQNSLVDESFLGRHQQKRTGIAAQVSHTYRQGTFSLTGEAAAHLSQLEMAGTDYDQQWLRVGLAQSWQYDKQAFSIGQQITAQWFDGALDETDWQGYNLGVSIFGKAFHMPMYVQAEKMKREDALLELGGFQSSLVDNTVMANTIYKPDLPFLADAGERYQGYGGGIAVTEGAPWLYYQQHQLDSAVFGQSYGLKWTTWFNGQDWSAKFAPAGISDMRLDFGISRVESEQYENENRAWMGIWFDL
ncbi:TolB family protein [Pseudoalteromonas phenolica]|uniref:TolB family protein n=1 Tax=Pseudoalteromonas phenolica TaxID=161398 RepID=UPI00207BA444|nr:hypothetical protein [Pseudoalteromonas phenolica]